MKMATRRPISFLPTNAPYSQLGRGDRGCNDATLLYSLRFSGCSAFAHSQSTVSEPEISKKSGRDCEKKCWENCNLTYFKPLWKGERIGEQKSSALEALCQTRTDFEQVELEGKFGVNLQQLNTDRDEFHNLERV